MTEKRFSVGFDIGEDYPFYMLLEDGENILFQSTSKIEVEEVCDLLNEQHETITTLTSALKELKEIGDYQADRIKELTEENTKLEEQLRNLRRLANELYMEGSE